MKLEVLRLDPSRFAAALKDGAPDLAPHPGEAALLSADHPFLRHGQWCGFVGLRGDRPMGRLVASADSRQMVNGRPSGSIGFIAGAARSDELIELIRSAEGWLAEQGAGTVRCPLQLSTWFGHRAVTAGFVEDGGSPPFRLEPATARDIPTNLRRAGFTVAHRAVSHVVENQNAIQSCERGIQRMRSAGFSTRPLDLDHLDSDLQVLHRLASQAFRRSWGYSEITFAEFATPYRQLAPAVDPDLVQILEDPDRAPVGFVFAIPDRSSTAEEGAPAKRFVLKTLGVLPQVSALYPGMGAGLVGIVHAIAEKKGYRRGVHALMAVDQAKSRWENHALETRRASIRWGSWIRSYATFERRIRQTPNYV
jgi:hypothetical protein